MVLIYTFMDWHSSNERFVKVGSNTGVITATEGDVTASNEAKVGSVCQLRAQLSMEVGIYFTSQRQCQIIAPPPPYLGIDLRQS
jgi:hypothetical protein